MGDAPEESETLKKSVSYDCHGFATSEGGRHEETESQYDSDHHLIESWTSVCDRWHHVQNMSPIKVRNLLKKGLPLKIRPRVWKLFLNSDAPKQQKHFDYQGNVKALMVMLEDYGISDEKGYANLREINKAVAALEEQERQNYTNTSLVHVKQILMDIDRTFPDHRLFSRDGPGKSSLLHVLAVYSQYNPAVGYCQGMSYVAAMLLMYLDEEDAFWAMVSLFEGPKYLANFYDVKFTKLQHFAEVFSMLLKERQCQLAKHLEGLGLHPLMYTVQWFLCLFTFLPCWDTVLLICDLLLLEGVTALLKAGLALMEQLSNELQAMDSLGEVIHFIQNPPMRLVSRSQMVQVLWRRGNNVDKQEMDALLDVATISSESEASSASLAKRVNRSSRKRPREQDNDKTKGQGTLQLLSRMIETPAKRLRQLTSASTISTAKRALSHRARKIPMKAPSKTNGMSPSAIELLPMENIPASFLQLSPMQNPVIWQGLDNQDSPYVFKSPSGSQQKCLTIPVRRSPRLRTNLRPSPNVFNISTMKGPVGSNPEEKLAFRIFNTPAPLKSHQEASSSRDIDNHIVSPEVELKDINIKTNNSPLNRALFSDEQ